MNDIDKILMNSTKAELIENLTDKLIDADKAIIILIEDKDEGIYTSQVMLLGINTTYEACGILEIGKADLISEDRE